MTLQEAIEICRRDEKMRMVSEVIPYHKYQVLDGVILFNGRMIFTPDIGVILGEWDVVNVEQ